MSESPFRCVTRPAIRGQDVGWVAQKRGLGLYQARFPTPRAAATWLANEMGVPLNSLRRQVVKKSSVALVMSEYKGVVRDRGLWMARLAGRNLGRYRSQAAAARCVARASGKSSIKSLKKKNKYPLTRMWALRLFKAGMNAFGTYLPGDLQSLRCHEHTSRHMFRKEPVRNTYHSF